MRSYIAAVERFTDGTLVIVLDYSVEDEHGYTIPAQYKISGEGADQLHEYLIGTLDALRDLVAPPVPS